MIKDVLLDTYYKYKCHPFYFLLVIIISLFIIFLAGPAYMPFSVMIISMLVLSLGSRMDYMIPVTNEYRIKRLKTEIIMKSIAVALLATAAMTRLKYLKVFHQRTIVCSPVYIVISALLVASLSISVAVETAQGVGAKGYINYDEKGKKKKKKLSVDFIAYTINLMGYIALSIFLFSAENKPLDIKITNDFNIIMIISIAVTMFCLIDSILLLKRIEIYDYTGEVSGSLVDSIG